MQNLQCHHTYGPLAQLVEHLTFNQVVWGSNPQWLMKKPEAQRFRFFICFFVQITAI